MPTQNPNIKYCPACGQMLAAYIPVCPKCNAVQLATPATAAYPSNRFPKSMLIVCILLGICACIYIFNSLQGWYFESQALKLKHDIEAKQEDDQAQRERRNNLYGEHLQRGYPPAQ